jgi:hypothetical protein
LLISLMTFGIFRAVTFDFNAISKVEASHCCNQVDIK